MASFTTKTTHPTATFSVQIPGGEFITRKLVEGETLSVGRGDTTDLRLDQPEIATLHCMITLEEDCVHIKDCYSSTGTFVDGQRIRDIRVQHDCSLLIGQTEIALTLPGGKAQRPNLNAELPQASAPTLTSESEEEEELIDDIRTDEVIDFDSDRIGRLLSDLEESQAENEVLRQRLNSLPKRKEKSAHEPDPFQAEMIEMMRAEIVALQEELESRNRADATFETPLSINSGQDLPDREEVEKLIGRLETLLDELHQKDEQIQVLQDLVLTAESANQAELEEREQLARWLSEFENRFEMLSGEWQAENAKLKEKIKEAEEANHEAQAALAADSSNVKTEALAKISDSLREQLAESQSEIQFLKQTNSQLRTKLDQAENSTPREEEIRLARERAEIARMRHDLEVRMHKLQIHSNNSSEDDEVELKLRNLTDQLRDPARSSKQNSSLSSRLMSLWGRLG